jgi:hypothetical protein
MSLGVKHSLVDSAAASAGAGTKKRTNKLDQFDEETVKLLSSTTPSAPSSRKRAASKIAELALKQQLQKQKDPSRKASKRAKLGKRSAVSQTSFVVMRGLPLTVSAGQVDKFFSGLSALEVFSAHPAFAR